MFERKGVAITRNPLEDEEENKQIFKIFLQHPTADLGRGALVYFEEKLISQLRA